MAKRPKKFGEGFPRGLWGQFTAKQKEALEAVSDAFEGDVPGQQMLDEVYENPLSGVTNRLDTPEALKSPYYGVNTASRPTGPAAAVAGLTGYGLDPVGEMLSPPSAASRSGGGGAMKPPGPPSSQQYFPQTGPGTPQYQPGNPALAAASKAGRWGGALKWGGRAFAALAVLDLVNRAYQGTVGADNEVRANAAGEALQAIPEMETAASLQQEQQLASFLSQTERAQREAAIPHIGEMAPDVRPLITERVDELAAISARQPPTLAELALRAGVTL